MSILVSDPWTESDAFAVRFARRCLPTSIGGTIPTAACASATPTPRTAQMHLPLTTALATGDALRHYRRLLAASRRSGQRAHPLVAHVPEVLDCIKFVRLSYFEDDAEVRLSRSKTCELARAPEI